MTHVLVRAMILYQPHTTVYARRKETLRLWEKRDLWESFCLLCGRKLGHVTATQCYLVCKPYMLLPDPAPSDGTGCFFKPETEE